MYCLFAFGIWGFERCRLGVAAYCAEGVEFALPYRVLKQSPESVQFNILGRSWPDFGSWTADISRQLAALISILLHAHMQVVLLFRSSE